MKGGYQIIDLRNIGLELSDSTGNITDVEILKQLRSLRAHIEKSHNYAKPLDNALKCIIVRYRDAKNSEKLEACQWANIVCSNDSLTYEIKTKDLMIEVVFEEKTDEYGNKYYDIKTAKYLYNHTEIVEGDLIVSGDATIGGDANFEGDIEIDGESTLQKWNGTLQLPEGLTLATSFCKVVRNFNELQFIANFRVVNNTESAITINSDLMFAIFEKLPNSINNKIYAHNGNACADNTSEGTIACAPLIVNLTNGPISTDNMPRYASLYHYEGQFRLYTEGGNIEIPSDYTLDFEVRISLAL